MFHHGLKGFFGFVLITDEEKKDFLLIKIISIVVNFLLETVGVKLFELFLFIIIINALKDKKKPNLTRFGFIFI